jgi:hypothetical protein
VKHEVALWAGVAAFFGSLVAIELIDVIKPGQWIQFVGSLIVAGITAGSVYSKERLSEAKKAEKAEKARADSLR